MSQGVLSPPSFSESENAIFIWYARLLSRVTPVPQIPLRRRCCRDLFLKQKNSFQQLPL